MKLWLLAYLSALAITIPIGVVLGWRVSKLLGGGFWHFADGFFFGFLPVTALLVIAILVYNIGRMP